MKVRTSLLLITTLILLISCKQSMSLPGQRSMIFSAQLYTRWVTAYKIDILNTTINSGEAIAKPMGIWVPLLKVHYLAAEASHTRQDCVFYRVPSPNRIPQEFGDLRVIEVFNEDCPSFPDRSDIKLDGIEQLHTYFVNKRARAGQEGSLTSENTLIFTVKMSNWEREFEMKLPMMNIESEPSHKRERYASGETLRQRPGVMVWPLSDSGLKLEDRVSSITYLGSSLEDFLDGDVVQCHQVGDDCVETIKYKCDQCRYGWFEGVGGKCPRINPKFCGTNRCGDRGWPACPVGFEITREAIAQGCYDGSNAGYCNTGLSTVCDENGVLICQ